MACAFASNAFSENAFSICRNSGGGSGGTGGTGSTGFDNEAFSEAYLKVRRAVEPLKTPELVLEAVKEVAEQAVKEKIPEKDYGKILRKKVRELDYRVNTAYMAMLNNLLAEYSRAMQELELAKEKQRDEDLAVIMLLLT